MCSVSLNRRMAYSVCKLALTGLVIVFGCGYGDEDVEDGGGFYALSAVDIDGRQLDFVDFRGKVVLIVNVASQCGFTESHYSALTRLRDTLGHTGHLEIVGFPCNQFGQQEPWEENQIKVNIH